MAGAFGRHWAKNVRELTTGQIFSSAKDASEILNVDYSSLHKVIRGQLKHVKGFVFEYVEKK